MPHGYKNEFKDSAACKDLLVILITAPLIYFYAIHVDLFETIVSWSERMEYYEIDEIILMCSILMFAFLYYSIRRWHEITTREKALEKINISLKEAIEEIDQLKGILPICSCCKRIRDENGEWHQIESYICNHSNADFSHGLCPECMRLIYPDVKNSSGE